MRPLVLILLCALLFATPSAVEAEVCNTINDLSNAWNSIANALEESSGDDIEDLDVDRLAGDVNTILPSTEELGDFLVEEGNDEENALGNDLLDMVEELYDVEGEDMAAYLVDRIDDIVDVLDDTVDYCDAVVDD